MTQNGLYIWHQITRMCRWHTQLIAMAIALLYVCPVFAQPPFPPPNQIQVFNIRGIDFGTFYPSTSGGFVTVDPTGTRSASGVVLVGGALGEAAIFDVVLIPGRLVSISYGPDVSLTGSNGGSMTLQVGPSDKGNSFVTSGGHPFRNQVNVGGTLQVSNLAANPPGSYQGTFVVTFHQN